MANKTENYKLTKPLATEFYDVEVQNSNMDKIDAAIKTIQDGQKTKADLVDGKVPANQLPSSVNNVVEGYLYNEAFYKDVTHIQRLPSERGKIYVDLSTNEAYRWSGAGYVVISQSVSLGETATEAYPGDKGKEAHNHIDSSVVGDIGCHNLRYHQNKLQVKDASGKWKSVVENYFKYFGLRIAIENDSPDLAVTYIDDAVGHSSGYDAWKDEVIFRAIKPCVMKNGAVQYYLNPQDLTYKTDGTPANITGVDGDVMVEIPKLGYKITTDGKYHYISVTDDPNAEGYCYRAHSLDEDGDCDKIYIGTYLGYLENSKLYSVSGKSPTERQTLAAFRDAAQVIGRGYQLVSFYPLTLLQCLYLMMYKSRNGQAALGYGYNNGNSDKMNTGGTNAKGMCFGEADGKQQMCFMGIEDFWGNLSWWVDGLYCDSSSNIKTAFKDFRDDGTNYPFSKAPRSSDKLLGYISDIQGTNEGGFIIGSPNGSSTTYYADAGCLSAGCCATFGGSVGASDSAGPYRLLAKFAATDAMDTTGARLMYKHTAT